MIKKKRKRMKLEKCFQCNKDVEVLYNRARKNWVEKNYWGCWTEKKEDEGKYICNKCILDLYYNDPVKYTQLIPNLKKREAISNNIYQGFYDE